MREALGLAPKQALRAQGSRLDKHEFSELVKRGSTAEDLGAGHAEAARVHGLGFSREPRAWEEPSSLPDSLESQPRVAGRDEKANVAMPRAAGRDDEDETGDENSMKKSRNEEKKLKKHDRREKRHSRDSDDKKKRKRDKEKRRRDSD